MWRTASGTASRLSMSMTLDPMTLPRMVKSSSTHVRAHSCVDPGEIGLLAREETGDCVYQYDVGRSGVETAGLFERQDPLHPAIALVTGRAQRALAPQHAKAQRPLCPVIGRLDAVVCSALEVDRPVS